MKKITSLLLAILILLCVLTACDPDAEEIDWANIKLGHVLPEPQSNLMKIVSNSEDNLLVYIHKMSENDYLEYQRWCENDKGFNIEIETVGTSFYAYNQEGYYLSLYFSESQDEMHITLDAPIPMENFELPEYAVAAGLPVPSSSTGHYNWQNTDSFFLYVGETSKDNYMLYKNACVAAGFIGDPYEYNTVYSATNAEGYKVSLNYQGFNIFTLEFYGPGSSGGNNTETNNPDNSTSEYALDYTDAASFESALNDGATVKGKIVQFDVVEYKPDSAMGINCWSGEHLNFISENTLDVTKGDIVIGRITEEPSKSFGSWKVPYEPLVIEGEKVESGTTEPSETQPTTIALTMGEDDFKGMNYKEAEKIFRKMGFTSFEYRTVDTEIESAADTISYIEITEWLIGDSNFVKGDKFDADSTVTFFSYKYEAPAAPTPVFYSTNDYETAKKGNTGVFSYKNKSGSYDVYWIIDFVEGYAYFFTEGNGEDYCDKVKLTSGTLNDRATITWNLDGEKTNWYLHFKYVNSPVTLIVNDHLGLTTEFTTTDLDDALTLRDTKKIQNS